MPSRSEQVRVLRDSPTFAQEGISSELQQTRSGAGVQAENYAATSATTRRGAAGVPGAEHSIRVERSGSRAECGGDRGDALSGAAYGAGQGH
jgi:hypothetical protein